MFLGAAQYQRGDHRGKPSAHHQPVDGQASAARNSAPATTLRRQVHAACPLTAARTDCSSSWPRPATSRFPGGQDTIMLQGYRSQISVTAPRGNTFIALGMVSDRACRRFAHRQPIHITFALRCAGRRLATFFRRR